ncbi:MAG TPA: HD domain-containing protein [Ktedonobacterales bacterium]
MANTNDPDRIAPASVAAGQSPAPSFRRVELSAGIEALVPGDLELKLPERSSLGADQLHFLVYIPWNEDYLSRVDGRYRDFFTFVLPYLHTRTTDVHIATCLPFVRELIQTAATPLDEQIVYVAFILHDVGWSQLSEAEIAASLSTTGVTLTKTAQGPKEKHALVGRDLAVKLLETYSFTPPLTETQKGWIAQAVLYHDKPWELAKRGELPLEIKLVCDVDHLWSLTHENFWQDTVRKGVTPPAYLDQLEKEVDGYFVTEPGKAKARHLLQERRQEVALWAKANDGAGGRN